MVPLILLLDAASHSAANKLLFQMMGGATKS